MTQNLHEWIAKATDLNQFDLAAVLVNDLHVPATAPHDLEKTFRDHDFARSFQRPQVILSLEIWTRHNLIFFQEWLAQRCCRIDHYHVVVIGQPGLQHWWRSYVSVMDLSSFTIHEVLDLPFGSHSIRLNWPAIAPHAWFRERWYADIPALPALDREIRYHCVYMCGGSVQNVEAGFHKHYLACQMLGLSSVLVDLRFRLPPVSVLANWLDCELGWTDQPHVDQLRQLLAGCDPGASRTLTYDHNLFAQSLPLYHHSFATVARESLLAQPWSCIGEKTLRPFMLGQFVIPTSYNAVSYLEDRGFWFDRSWFDFSYEREKNTMRRLRQLVNSVREMTDTDLDQCRQHLHTHRERYMQNSELARQLTVLQSE